jgi:hypothetical protein
VLEDAEIDRLADTVIIATAVIIAKRHSLGIVQFFPNLNPTVSFCRSRGFPQPAKERVIVLFCELFLVIRVRSLKICISWQGTIDGQRFDIEKVIEEQSKLKAKSSLCITIINRR